MEHQNLLNQNFNTKPRLIIDIQPARNDQRFRYKIEGRSAGSIKGANWTPENPTFPKIHIEGYNKSVTIFVTCITKDKPYYQHPHKLVGRNDVGQKYENGICILKIDGNPMEANFSNLGIQCTKKTEIKNALIERRTNKFIPFNDPPTSVDKVEYNIHEVRLCFQAYLNEFWIPLEPVISEPIVDKKISSDLSIICLSACTGKVSGGDDLILCCEKVVKNDIRIKFTEYCSDWYDYGKIFYIHKQSSICFKTPRYKTPYISTAVKALIQLERPSNKTFGVPLDFEFYPDSVSDFFERKRTTYLRKYKFYYSPKIKIEQVTKPEPNDNQDDVPSTSSQISSTVDLSNTNYTTNPNNVNQNQLQLITYGCSTYPTCSSQTTNNEIKSENEANMVNMNTSEINYDPNRLMPIDQWHVPTMDPRNFSQTTSEYSHQFEANRNETNNFDLFNTSNGYPVGYNNTSTTLMFPSQMMTEDSRNVFINQSENEMIVSSNTFNNNPINNNIPTMDPMSSSQMNQSEANNNNVDDNMSSNIFNNGKRK